jgi:hypothetical protein
LKEILVSHSSSLSASAAKEGLYLGQGTPPTSSSSNSNRREQDVEKAFKRALMECIARDGFRDVGRKVSCWGDDVERLSAASEGDEDYTGKSSLNQLFRKTFTFQFTTQVEELVREDDEVREMLRNMWGW